MARPSTSNIVERAYELARSGMCTNFSQVGKSLKKEGYQISHIEQYFVGRSIRRELNSMCKQAVTRGRA